mgnify:CR=1 FL=1
MHSLYTSSRKFAARFVAVRTRLGQPAKRYEGWSPMWAGLMLVQDSRNRGGNQVNMLKIIDGQFCGACHNGELAWSVENCNLCHSAKPGTATQVHVFARSSRSAMYNSSANLYAPTGAKVLPGGTFSVQIPSLYSNAKYAHNYTLELSWPDTTAKMLSLGPFPIALAVSAPYPRNYWTISNATNTAVGTLKKQSTYRLEWKFTRTGGVVFAVQRTETGDDTIRFAVSDTGTGISAEDLGKLFEPFSQVGNRASAAASGTGLGLAISRSLVERMGSRLQVESQPQSLLVHAFHTFPDNNAVVKTQSLLEF